MTAADRRARFRALHDGPGIFVMPNPWDAGSARLLAAAGFPALATTSLGLALTLGRLDQQVTRDELVAHVADVAAATDLPLNVDAERCFPDDPGGVAEAVRLLAEAGAAGVSIEDYDPASGRIEAPEVAVAKVAEAAAACRAVDPPLVLTGRAENHLYGVDDLDDTIARLRAYVAAGVDVAYAPRLAGIDRIERLAGSVPAPLNVLLLEGFPPLADLEAAGVRRVSTGGWLARAAYGALTTAAAELAGPGTCGWLAGALPAEALRDAFAED